jgi:hypothetical protein
MQYFGVPNQWKKKQKTKNTTFKRLQPDGEGKWTSNEKLKNALIASTHESIGVIANKHII